MRMNLSLLQCQQRQQLSEPLRTPLQALPGTQGTAGGRDRGLGVWARSRLLRHRPAVLLPACHAVQPGLREVPANRDGPYTRMSFFSGLWAWPVGSSADEAPTALMVGIRAVGGAISLDSKRGQGAPGLL